MMIAGLPPVPTAVHIVVLLALLPAASAFGPAGRTVALHGARRCGPALRMQAEGMCGTASAPWSRRSVVTGALAVPTLWLPGRGAADVSSEAATIGKRTLGKGAQGLQVPDMGVGAWAWGDSAVWGYGSSSGASEASIERAYRASIDNGVTLLDTAEVYGLGVSETILGRLLAATPQPERARVQVATKFYPVDPKYNFPRSAKDLIPALDASLARLQLDCVDLYQIHNPGILSGKAVGEALAEAVKSGRCKAVGVSNYGLDEIMPVYKALEKQGIPLASNQIEFSLLRQLPMTGGLISACRDLGMGILAYSPLGMGRLTGKYGGKSNKAPGGRFFGRVQDETLDVLLLKMREIGAVHGGKTPAQVALNWLICQGAVPIPGAKNEKQATDNAGALGWRLSEEEVAVLASLGKEGGTNIWQHDGRV